MFRIGTLTFQILQVNAGAFRPWSMGVLCGFNGVEPSGIGPVRLPPQTSAR
jgi:hypothetical protein